MPTAMLISACEVNQKKPEAICKAKAPEGSRSWSASHSFSQWQSN